MRPEEFADEKLVEIVAAFMLQPHLDPERNELREFTVAALTARDVYDVVKRNLLFDKQYRRRMRRSGRVRRRFFKWRKVLDVGREDGP